MNYRQQENNYPKAFLATGIILVLLMVLSYFLVFKMPPKQDEGTGGILVNYGTTPEGMGDDYMSTEEPSVAEKANHTRPDKVTPAPPTEEKTRVDNSSKPVLTQNNEDAPEVSANKNKPAQTVAANPIKTVTPPKPTINQNALYKGKTNNGTGEGDGTTGKPGNQGVPTGSTLTPDYGQGGNGTGGSLQGADGRNYAVKPSLTVDRTVDGVVVVDITIDKGGNVVDASAGRGTTVDNYAVKQKYIEAARRARITASDSAPDQQRAKIVFRFKSR